MAFQRRNVYPMAPISIWQRFCSATLLLLLLLAASLSFASSSNQQRQRQSIPASSLKDDDELQENINHRHLQTTTNKNGTLSTQILSDGSGIMCHTMALKSQPSSSTTPTTTANEIAQPYGFIFSIQNTNTAINQEVIDISSLSIMLDTNYQVNFTLYVRDGFYMGELGEDGTIVDSAIGMELLSSSSGNSNQQQWEEIASGEFLYSRDFVTDEDGATLIPFNSMGDDTIDSTTTTTTTTNSRTIGIASGGVKSFYLKMTGFSLQVERGDDLVGETVDELAYSSSGDNDDGGGLELYVGRGVSQILLHICVNISLYDVIHTSSYFAYFATSNSLTTLITLSHSGRASRVG